MAGVELTGVQQVRQGTAKHAEGCAELRWGFMCSMQSLPRVAACLPSRLPTALLGLALRACQPSSLPVASPALPLQ